MKNNPRKVDERLAVKCLTRNEKFRHLGTNTSLLTVQWIIGYRIPTLTLKFNGTLIKILRGRDVSL